MKIVIRADASSSIGYGHVVRCLALAKEAIRRGAEVVFVCRRTIGDASVALERAGVEVHWLAMDAAGSEAEAAETGDAEQTRAFLTSSGAVDWLVVDHYGLGVAWERALRPTTRRLLVIDDVPGREHDCDLLVDQNLGAADRTAVLPPAALQLLGPAFALVRPEFSAVRRDARSDGLSHRRLLLFLGAGVGNAETFGFAGALVARSSGDFAVDVVTVEADPGIGPLRELAALSPVLELHVHTTDMAELMSRATLMIGAAGSTSWERATIGLPALVVTVAANQRPIASALARARASIDLGQIERTNADAVADVAERLLHRPGLLARMARRARRLCDGRGASRVVAAMGLPLELTILSDGDSWINARIGTMVAGWRQQGHRVRWVHDPVKLVDGDVAFLISCSRVIPPERLALHAHNLVVHESALPHGRGWSPMTWQVLEGRARVPISLFEAVARVDAGPVYLQGEIELQGHELVEEIRELQAEATMRLCRKFVDRYPFVLGVATPQRGEASFYPRRAPADSELDPDLSLRDQFNLLRVVDNERYPAFFDLDGHGYRLRIERMQDD